MPLRVIDLHEISTSKFSIKEILKKCVLSSMLYSNAMFFDNFDVFISKSEKKDKLSEALPVIQQFSGLVFFATELPWLNNFEQSTVLNIEFTKPDYKQRKKIWKSLKENIGDSWLDKDLDFDILSSKFHFTIKDIDRALAHAKNLAISQTPNNIITADDLNQACKSVSNQNLTKLARKIEPQYSWSDLILPQSKLSLLKDVCNHVQNRSRVFGDWGFDKKFSIGKGLAVLFKGESGTGKTMAAEVISRELALDLYKIDLSTIVSQIHW